MLILKQKLGQNFSKIFQKIFKVIFPRPKVSLNVMKMTSTGLMVRCASMHANFYKNFTQFLEKFHNF